MRDRTDSLERSLIRVKEITRSRPDKSGSGLEQRCCSCATPRCQLLFLSVAFFFVFTGFSGAQNLESSIDLGTVSGSVSMGIIYVVFTLTCLVAPFIVKHLGPKHTILAQFVIIALFCTSNIYPRVWTMYPASALLGFGAAPMWVAQGEYVSTLAERHYNLNTKDVYGLFNGIFYGIFQFTQVSGNLISAFVLHNGSGTTNTPTSAPTPAPAEWLASTDKVAVPDVTKCILYVSYIICCGIGFVVLTLWVKRLKPKEEQPEPAVILASGRFKSVGQKMGTGPSIMSTFRLMLRPQLFFIIPVMVANGLEMGFAYSSLTGNVITRNLGQENIGYGMIVFGAVNTLSSFFFGKVSDKAGPVICICFAFVVQNGCVAWLYYYFDDLKQDSWLDIFIVCGVWGFCDGILQTLLSAILGMWFSHDKEAAFANWKMWQSFGISVMFFLQDSLGLQTKLLIVSVAWCLGIFGLLLSRVLRRSNNREYLASINTQG